MALEYRITSDGTQIYTDVSNDIRIWVASSVVSPRQVRGLHQKALLAKFRGEVTIYHDEDKDVPFVLADDRFSIYRGKLYHGVRSFISSLNHYSSKAIKIIENQYINYSNNGYCVLVDINKDIVVGADRKDTALRYREMALASGFEGYIARLNRRWVSIRPSHCDLIKLTSPAKARETIDLIGQVLSAVKSDKTNKHELLDEIDYYKLNARLISSKEGIQHLVKDGVNSIPVLEI